MTTRQSVRETCRSQSTLDWFFSSANPEEARSRLEDLMREPPSSTRPETGAKELAARLRRPSEWPLPAAFWLFAAETYLRGGMHGECRKAIQRALAADDDELAPQQLCQAYHTLGDLEASENRWKEAVTAWGESLKFVIHDDPVEMTLRRSLAEGWEALGAVERAAYQYDEALKLAARDGAAHAECELLCLLGQHFMSRDCGDQAASYFIQARERAREEGIRSGEAAADIGYASLCLETGELEAAERALAAGLAIAREIGDPLLQVAGLERTAELKRTTGDTDEAQAALEQAVFLAKASGSAAALASLYHMVAMLHEDRGRTGLALATYEKALTERRLAFDQAGLGATLTNLGSIYMRRGDVKTARDFYREALLAFNASGRDRRELAIVLENLRRLDRFPTPPRTPQTPVEDRDHLDRRHRPG